jgi:hypothetical protein
MRGSGAAVGPTCLQFGQVIWVSIGRVATATVGGWQENKVCAALGQASDVRGASGLVLNSVVVS